MKNEKTKIIVLVSIIIALIGAVTIILVVNLSNTSYTKYKKLMNTGNKYVQSEDWDEAIAAYRDAISSGEADEEAYYMLAQIYIYKNMMDEAKSILEEGIEKTGSQKLQDYYNQYFGTDTKNDGEKDDDDEKVLMLNTGLLRQISAYTYADYNRKYGTARADMANGICTVIHRNLLDVKFLYYNTADKTSIIDENTNKPNENKIPCEIQFANLNVLLSGDDITYENISKLNVRGLKKEFNAETNSDVIVFESEKCIVQIACDSDGNVANNAWNKIEPKYGNNNEEDIETKAVEGAIVSATTGAGIPSVQVVIRNIGEHSGEAVIETQTDRKGNYEAELEPGNYTAEVSCEGYVTEYIDFEVDKWGESNMSQFVMSEEMKAGEIRIVLEWGEYPYDLDSHLTGTDSNGNDIHVHWRDKIHDAAELDVDDTSSFGPETITIHDINGEYQYYVYDYGETGNISISDATVKVYLPGKSSPKVFKVPSGLENTWNVFSIKDGKLVE